MATPTDSNNWYVKDDVGVHGPLSESDMRRQLNRSMVQQVKQGESDWYPAQLMRRRIAELSANGIYVEHNGVAEGPYTLTKAHELLQSSNVDNINVRTGIHGEWVPRKRWLSSIHALLDRQQQQSTETSATAEQDDLHVAPGTANADSDQVDSGGHSQGEETDLAERVTLEQLRSRNRRNATPKSRSYAAIIAAAGLLLACLAIVFLGLRPYSGSQPSPSFQGSDIFATGEQHAPYEQVTDPTEERSVEMSNAISSINRLGNAMTHVDLAEMVECYYPPFVRAAGGRERVLRFWNRRIGEMARKGTRSGRFDLGKLDSVHSADGNLFVVIPYKLSMWANSKSMRLESSMLGISTDGGDDWKFVDSAIIGSEADQIDEELILRVLPDFPFELGFPRR